MPPFGFWPRQASNIGGSPSRVTTEFGGSCWSPERCWGRLESRTEGLLGNETVYKKAQTSAQNAPREEVEEEEEDGVGGGEIFTMRTTQGRLITRKQALPGFRETKSTEPDEQAPDDAYGIEPVNADPGEVGRKHRIFVGMRAFREDWGPATPRVSGKSVSESGAIVPGHDVSGLNGWGKATEIPRIAHRFPDLFVDPVTDQISAEWKEGCARLAFGAGEKSASRLSNAGEIAESGHSPSAGSAGREWRVVDRSGKLRWEAREMPLWASPEAARRAAGRRRRINLSFPIPNRSAGLHSAERVPSARRQQCFRRDRFRASPWIRATSAGDHRSGSRRDRRKGEDGKKRPSTVPSEHVRFESTSKLWKEVLDKADMDAAAAPEIRRARTETQSQEEEEAGREKAEAERAEREKAARKEAAHKAEAERVANATDARKRAEVKELMEPLSCNPTSAGSVARQLAVVEARLLAAVLDDDARVVELVRVQIMLSDGGVLALQPLFAASLVNGLLGKQGLPLDLAARAGLLVGENSWAETAQAEGKIYPRDNARPRMAVLDCARVSSEQEEVQDSLEFSEGVTYREMSEQWVAGGGAMRAVTLLQLAAALGRAEVIRELLQFPISGTGIAAVGIATTMPSRMRALGLLAKVLRHERVERERVAMREKIKRITDELAAKQRSEVTPAPKKKKTAASSRWGKLRNARRFLAKPKSSTADEAAAEEAKSAASARWTKLRNALKLFSAEAAPQGARSGGRHPSRTPLLLPADRDELVFKGSDDEIDIPVFGDCKETALFVAIRAAASVRKAQEKAQEKASDDAAGGAAAGESTRVEVVDAQNEMIDFLLPGMNSALAAQGHGTRRDYERSIQALLSGAGLPTRAARVLKGVDLWLGEERSFPRDSGRGTYFNGEERRDRDVLQEGKVASFQFHMAESGTTSATVAGHVDDIPEIALVKCFRRAFVEKLRVDHAGTSVEADSRDSSRDHLRAVWTWFDVSSFWLSFCLKLADEARHERLREKKRDLVMGVDSADEFDLAKMTGISRDLKLARDFCEKAEDSKLGYAILQQLREAIYRFAEGSGSGIAEGSGIAGMDHTTAGSSAWMYGKSEEDDLEQNKLGAAYGERAEGPELWRTWRALEVERWSGAGVTYGGTALVNHVSARDRKSWSEKDRWEVGRAVEHVDIKGSAAGLSLVDNDVEDVSAAPHTGSRNLALREMPEAGMRPLHVAIELDDEDIARLLVRCGADVEDAPGFSRGGGGGILENDGEHTGSGGAAQGRSRREPTAARSGASERAG